MSLFFARFERIIFIVGLLLYVLLFLVFGFSSFFYILNIKVDGIIVIISLTTIFLLLFKFKKYLSLFSFDILLVFLLTIVVLIVTSSLSKSVLVDLSYDGRSYHQEAIIQLMNGWNPYREMIFPDVWDHSYAIWLNHFPKFSWICWYVFSSMFGSLEAGKMVNMILGLAALFIVYSILRKRQKSIIYSFLLALLCLINPIFLVQFSSYYLDSQLLFSILIFLISSWSYLTDKSNRIIYILLIIVSIIFSINIKVTGLAYIPILGIYFLIYAARLNKIVWKRLFITYLLGGLLAFFLFGFNPYITTIVKYGNPFYPMYSRYPINEKANKDQYVDLVPALPYIKNIREFIYSSNIPTNFHGLNRFQKLYYSIFSRSSNIDPIQLSDGSYVNGNAVLKFPWIASEQEFLVFKNTDVRVGGFGPFFALSLLLSFFCIMILIIVNRIKALSLILFYLIVFLSISVNSELWWARYVPQLWIAPLVVVYLIEEEGFLKYFGRLILVILLLNCFLIGKVSLINIYRSSQYDIAYMSNIAKQNDIVLIDFSALRARRWRYKEKGVKFLEEKIEIGVFENHFVKSLNDEDYKNMISCYIKNISEYKYVLSDKCNISKDVLEKIYSKGKTVFVKNNYF